MKENVLIDKSKDLALRIIRMYKYLCDEKKNLSCRSKYYEAVQASGQILGRRTAHSRKKISLQN